MVIKVLNSSIRLQVFDELGGNHDGGDEQPVDVHRRNAELLMELNEAVDSAL